MMASQPMTKIGRSNPFQKASTVEESIDAS
jgi:hypothetical protein